MLPGTTVKTQKRYNMEIKNKDLIELLKSFQEDLKNTIKENKLKIDESEINDLFEAILVGWLDGGGIVGFDDLTELLQDTDQITKEYESMHDVFDDNPDQVYADAFQRKLNK